MSRAALQGLGHQTGGTAARWELALLQDPRAAGGGSAGEFFGVTEHVLAQSLANKQQTRLLSQPDLIL